MLRCVTCFPDSLPPVGFLACMLLAQNLRASRSEEEEKALWIWHFRGLGLQQRRGGLGELDLFGWRPETLNEFLGLLSNKLPAD